MWQSIRPGHGDEAGRVDDDRAVVEVDLVANLVAVADGDDLARVGGDPHVALVHLDVAEGGAAQRLAGLASRASRAGRGGR